MCKIWELKKIALVCSNKIIKKKNRPLEMVSAFRDKKYKKKKYLCDFLVLIDKGPCHFFAAFKKNLLYGPKNEPNSRHEKTCRHHRHRQGTFWKAGEQFGQKFTLFCQILQFFGNHVLFTFNLGKTF